MHLSEKKKIKSTCLPTTQSYAANTGGYRITSCQIETLLVCCGDKLVASPFCHLPTCALTEWGTIRDLIPSSA